MLFSLNNNWKSQLQLYCCQDTTKSKSQKVWKLNTSAYTGNLNIRFEGTRWLDSVFSVLNVSQYSATFHIDGFCQILQMAPILVINNREPLFCKQCICISEMFEGKSNRRFVIFIFFLCIWFKLFREKFIICIYLTIESLLCYFIWV